MMYNIYEVITMAKDVTRQQHLLSARVQELRNENNITREDVALMTNNAVSKRMMDCIELKTRTASMSNIIYIASSFGVSSDWLIGMSNNKYTEASVSFAENRMQADYPEIPLSPYQEGTHLQERASYITEQRMNMLREHILPDPYGQEFMESLNNTRNERITSLRENHNISISLMAKLTQGNITEITIKDLETGNRKPTLSSIVALSECTGVTNDWIMGVGNEKYTEESVKNAWVKLRTDFPDIELPPYKEVNINLEQKALYVFGNRIMETTKNWTKETTYNQIRRHMRNIQPIIETEQKVPTRTFEFVLKSSGNANKKKPKTL